MPLHVIGNHHTLLTSVKHLRKMNRKLWHGLQQAHRTDSVFKSWKSIAHLLDENIHHRSCHKKNNLPRYGGLTSSHSSAERSSSHHLCGFTGETPLIIILAGISCHGGHTSKIVDYLHHDITPTRVIVVSPATHLLVIHPSFYIPKVTLYE